MFSVLIIIMKLVIIFGPQAVGKTTVGLELEKLTGLKLFHNHMTMDLVAPFFYYETPTFGKLVKAFRLKMFREIAKSDLEGVIFTYAWGFNKPSNAAFIAQIVRIFKKQKGEIFYVELEADQKVRLKRNRSAFRLSLKPNKKDLKASEKSLLDYDNKYVMNTDGRRFSKKSYIKINNTKLSPKETANLIASKFGFFLK